MKSEKNKSVFGKIKRLRSLHMAMWGYFCLTAFILIALVEIVFYIVVANTFEIRARERIASIGEEIVWELKAPHDKYDKIFSRYISEGVNVYVIGTDGAVLLPENPTAELDESIITDCLKRLAGVDETANVIFRAGNSLNFVQKCKYNGESCVIVRYSLSIIQDSVKTLQLYLLLVGVAVLAVSLLVFYSASQKLTGGIKTMSDTAVKMAHGNYDVKFTNFDYKEMAQLSDTLNYVRDEVKKSGDFQREILANVSHDLKTPLTMIKAYASMIKEISGDNREKREKHLQVIIDEADRLTGLVNDVLSVSKLQSNMEQINRKVFNLTELTYSIINKFGYLQETMGYSLLLDIESNLYTCADESKIGQVIYNLLGNAANYTGEDKNVYITLKSNLDGSRIKFSVRDTGQGIAKEDLPEIWNRYYRLSENHTRPVKGTGLGLNIVKGILENHSFDFGVDSNKGEGSTFWVDFPAVPSDLEKEEQ